MFDATAQIPPAPDPHTDAQPGAGAERAWQTVVWNDDVNLTSYVAYVFQQHFGYSADVAVTLMHRVHEQGRAAVATGHKGRMVEHCEALQLYGLWATIERDE